MHKIDTNKVLKDVYNMKKTLKNLTPNLIVQNESLFKGKFNYLFLRIPSLYNCILNDFKSGDFDNDDFDDKLNTMIKLINSSDDQHVNSVKIGEKLAIQYIPVYTQSIK